MKYLSKDVVIIGGGASGLCAAVSAAGNGDSVLILEHMDRVGKKLLSTGNGKCNFTNEYLKEDCYFGTGKPIALSLIQEYDTLCMKRFFQKLGIEPVQKNGYYYPASGQAASVLDVLRMECESRGVLVMTGCEIRQIDCRKGQYRLFCRGEEEFTVSAKAILLAAGSKAVPSTGSDGSGYELAKAFGHTVTSIYPALTNLKTEGEFRKAWAGVRTAGEIRLLADGREIAAEKGELQLTDYGISGIPVFQLSRFAGELLRSGKKVEAFVRFWPDSYAQDTEKKLKARMDGFSSRTLIQGLTGLLPSKLCGVLIREAGLKENRDCHLTKEEYARLAKAGNAFCLKIKGTGDFKQAQVCAGGVDGREIECDTMESKLAPGLFFAGEILDVDGKCGGYNLHFAFASGMRAAKGMHQFIRKHGI